MKKQIYIGISLVLVMTLMGACKSKEKLAKEGVTVSSKSLVRDIQNAQPDYQTLEFKRMQIALNLNNKQKYRSSATAKIIRDSVIHISVQPFLGIELFVARITPESITVVDKTKLMYYQSDYDLLYLLLGIDIDYKSLEAMFSNRLFALGQTPKTDLEKQFIKANNRKISSKHEALTQEVMVDDNFRIKELRIYENPISEEFSVKYADFTKTNMIDFPSSINLQYKSKTELFTFDMAINTLAINQNIKIQDINYQQYRKGDLRSLLKK